MIRVLLVEDDPMVAELNRMYLSRVPGFETVASARSASEALDRPRRDQPRLRVREPARQRRAREEGDPDDEEPEVPEEVTEPSAEQQEAAERQEVGVHDPRERRLREVEVLADRRQRDPDDGHRLAVDGEVAGERLAAELDAI